MKACWQPVYMSTVMRNDYTDPLSPRRFNAPELTCPT
jgi:hypothetical protein